MPHRVRTIGLFYEGYSFPDDLWNQCDGSAGAHGDLVFRFNDARADHVLCMGPPRPIGGWPKPGWLSRSVHKARGTWDVEKASGAFRLLAREPADVSVFIYEPASSPLGHWYEASKRFASRVYGPDPRATHPCRMPALWQVDLSPSSLRALPPPDKTPIIVTICSGKSALPGHQRRLEFLRALRRAGVAFELYGRNLPRDLEPFTTLRAKTTALIPAMFTLSIENDPQGDQYVSEKLWDPLLCWSLPIYFGSRAADAMIPGESFIRLPDLGPAGVEVVRDALTRGERLWRERLDAIAHARRRILSEHRLVDWVAREIAPRIR